MVVALATTPRTTERDSALSIRDSINANQNIVVVAAVVVIVTALLFIMMQGGGRTSSRPGDVYFFDTVTKEIFKDDIEKLPPIQSPDGNPAVRVHLFSFGDCDNEDERFIGYYEKYTDEAKAKLEELTKSGNGPESDAEQEMILIEYAEFGLLYSVDGEEWFSPHEIGLDNLIEERLNSDKGRAKYCRAK